MRPNFRRSSRTTFRRLLAPAALLGAVGFLLPACLSGASLENKEDHLVVGPVDACDPTPIFEASCASGICHSIKDDGSPPSGGVDLISPGVAARVLDVDATYPGLSGCATVPEKLVSSVDFEASLMWKKLNDTHECGDSMPLGLPLGATQMECVRSWMADIIASGAGAGTGGMPGTGGAPGTGGTPGTGGAADTGGTSGTGGAAGTGGSSTGGAVGTGGATGTGGAL